MPPHMPPPPPHINIITLPPYSTLPASCFITPGNIRISPSPPSLPPRELALKCPASINQTNVFSSLHHSTHTKHKTRIMSKEKIKVGEQ